MESFNEYYVNVGQNIANNIKFNQNFDAYQTSVELVNCPASSMAILNINLTEVISTIDSLKNPGSIDGDKIPAIIKQNKYILAGPIVHICNLAISTGKFPNIKKNHYSPWNRVERNGCHVPTTESEDPPAR